jgi:Undecaprenyl-phosphate galactose phosphotransferase WbaP
MIGTYAHLWAVLLLFPVAYGALGLYPGFGRSPVDVLRRLSAATSLVYPALAVTIFLLKDGPAYSRAVFLLAWIQSLATVPLTRGLVRYVMARRRWWGDEVAVIGTGDAPFVVARSLAKHAELGLKPVMVVDEPHRALQLIKTYPVRHAILVGGPRIDLAELYGKLSWVFPRITVVPDLTGLSSLWAEPRDLGGMIGLEIGQRLLMPGVRLIKRVVDLCSILAVAALSLPVIVIIALAIKLTSPGPVFYGHVRYGRGGRPFVAWKFRSMVTDASTVLERHLTVNPALRTEWSRDYKLKRDPRITTVGRMLRRTSLDELPQIWNVVVGQMSLVGPRPIVAGEIQYYGEAFELYKQVLPGITGMWQVSGRNNLTYGERVQCDLYYIRNWSPWLDLYILARTVTAVLLARGAY